MIQIINDIINDPSYKENFVYLVEKIDCNSAFLLNSGNILFAVSSDNEPLNEFIDTEKLSLRSNVFIDTVVQNPSFEPGKYNILIYKGDINNEMFKSFVELCKTYVTSIHNMTIVDFFYSLIDLFKLPEHQSFLNAIGCFGELSFIKNAYIEHRIDISNNWHKNSDSNSKYDFCFKKINVEIKTTDKEENVFNIKHNQLFNNNNNYLVAYNICCDNSGETLADIFDYFKKEVIFSNNLEFQIKLEKERIRINERHFASRRFTIVKSKAYFNKKLDTINSTPDCITSVSYLYNFENSEFIELKDLYRIIKGQ